MLHTSSDHDLILALFAAAVGDAVDRKATQLWDGFLQELRDATQADSVTVELVQTSGFARLWSIGEGARLDATQREAMRENRVYSQTDLPGSDPDQPPLRALKWRVGGQGMGTLVLRRATADFRAVDSSRLSALLPFLDRAFSTWLTLTEERECATLDQRIGSALNTGWGVLGFNGMVSHLNPTAHRLLKSSGRMSLESHGRFGFSDPRVAQGFRNALADLAAGAKPDVTVQVSQAPLFQMTLSLHPWRGEPALLVILRHEPSVQALDLSHAAKVLHLSRSETRLAALICDGLSLQDAATSLGWTEDTARSCSKKIYAQLEVRGQTGLLRRILNSTLWFTAPR
ncbi:hypothetical protein [Pararhodobacter sp.]|uniref:helix-turn-helix transcriptional regulator n=1 Tax=Pararhodobacter sp. TaxID=2127056 RepID=UPI002AFDD442|nr:hypothetical protein [Pararhodobacter sp.]